MLDSISFNLPCQKAQFEEASHSPYVKVSLVALGSILFLISMLVFYRIPRMNSLGMSGGWSFFGCGFAALLGGVLVRCKEKMNLENENSREIRLLGNRDVTQSVEPCLLLNPFDHPNFNDELLVHFFSFLTPDVLVKATRVAKRWHACLKEESLWQCHCLRLINQPKPEGDTWREHYKKIYNWMTGRAQKTTCKPTEQVFRSNAVTLLEDGTGLEIMGSFNLSTYEIRNVVSNETRTIDLNSNGNPYVDKISFYGKTCAILDFDRNVFCFDLTSGLHKAFSNHNAESIKRGYKTRIYCNENEVIAFYDFKFTIWNLNQPEKPTLTIDFEVEIDSLFSTQNFIIGCVLDNLDNFVSPVKSVHFVNKNNGESSVGSYGLYSYENLMAASGPYLAYFNQQGLLETYKEISNELTLLHRIVVRSQLLINPIMQIFQNWVLFSNKGVLKIWNADTGTLLSDIRYGSEIMFDANFDKLLVRAKMYEDFSSRTYNYTFYDFSPPKKKNNSNKKFSISNIFSISRLFS